MSTKSRMQDKQDERKANKTDKHASSLPLSKCAAASAFPIS